MLRCALLTCGNVGLMPLPYSTKRGSVRALQVRSGDPFEVSQGRLIYCAPTGGQGSEGNRLGASVVGWDPAVKVNFYFIHDYAVRALGKDDLGGSQGDQDA